jgi:hypothetical protein
MAEIGNSEGGRVFEAVGITAEVLAKQAWDELHSTVTKTAKLKGAVLDNLPEGYRIIAETEEETIIQWDERNWGTQQAARMDAQKLLGLYPVERRELTGPDGGPIQSESQLVVQAGQGLSGLIASLRSSGIAGPGPEDDQ